MQKPEEKLTLPHGTIIPNHIAIILDGNRRWARARGLNTLQGHKAGFDAARGVANSARQLGIHTLTVWGFSTENWDRSEMEISYLMRLFRRFVLDVRREAREDGIRFVHLGRKDRLPRSLVKLISEVEAETKNHKKHVLNVALDYGGRDEIVRAVKKIINNSIPAEKIDEKLFSNYLDTANQLYPYPDLFIRPSGEQRTSGLLPWQMTYAEYYWEKDHLPDMTPEKLREAIIDYSRRRRRFGGNDTLEHFKFKPALTAKFEIAWWRLGKIPQGTKFSEYAMAHFREQWGLSKHLARDAAKLFVQAAIEGEDKKWEKANAKLKKFYKLIKDEVKLAFEPSIVASIDVKLMQKTTEENVSVAEIEDLVRTQVAEVYRISDLQASKAAHLRALASVERTKGNWESAKEYLELYYKALKDRVA